METLLDELEGSGIICAEHMFVPLIWNYGIASKPRGAFELFLKMEGFSRVKRSVKAFNTLLNALVLNKFYDLVYGLFKNCKKSWTLCIM